MGTQLEQQQRLTQPTSLPATNLLTHSSFNMAIALHHALPLFQVNRLMSSALDDELASSRSLMEMHFRETGTSYAVEAELPGFGDEDVQLEVHQGLLKITASKKLDHTSEDGSSVTKRRRSATRTVKVPDDVQVSGIAASMDKGVLSITLPKVPETAPQKIIVTGAAAQQQAPPEPEQESAEAEAGDN